MIKSISDKPFPADARNAGGPSGSRVREQVRKIIQSPAFVNSIRMQRFLDFTVEQALKGKGDSLKEYSIALAVFDKSQSFDPRLDPIVRVEAGRLRSKLREYYEGPGRLDPVRITYRKRSYIPLFKYQSLERGESPREPHAGRGASMERIEPAESYTGEGEPKVQAIAVLPFTNLSVSRKHGYFGDAITAEIINVLSQTAQLNIVSRTSVMRFKNTAEDVREIAGRLGVDAVLEGSVRLAGKRVRVAAQLANAESGYQIWSQIYDRQLTDIFDVQRNLAQAISKALKVELQRFQPGSAALFGTENSTAYHLYLRGRHFLNRGLRKDLRVAARLFKKAVDCDPEYALAYAGSADAYAALCWAGEMPPKKCWQRSQEMAQKALDIDDTLGHASIALAHRTAAYEWAWEDAEKAFLHGIKLSPNYANGYRLYALACLAPQGRLAQAEDEIRAALNLNSGSAPISAELGWVLYCRRRYESALEQLAESIRIDPLYYRSYLYMGYAYQQQSKLDEAFGAFTKARELSQQESIADGALGRCLGLMGKQIDALRLLRELTERSKKTYTAAVDIADIHNGLGEIKHACEWLDRALIRRCPRLIRLNVDPAYDSLKSNPKFLSFLKKMKLDYVHT